MKILRKKNYIFFIDEDMPNDSFGGICDLIDNRTFMIADVLQISIDSYQKKTKYFIKISNRILGRFQDSLIYCETENIENLLEPFVHEECHDIVYRHWGCLPCFLFEGIAEYVLFLFEGKNPSVLDFILDLPEQCKKELKAKKEMLLTNVDKKKNPFFRHTFFYRAGRSFVAKIIDCSNMETLHSLFSMFRDNYQLYLQNISEFFDTWVESI